jgi:hypothetical protein
VRPHGVPGVFGAAKEVREVRVRGVKVLSVLRAMRRTIKVRGEKAGTKETPLAPEHPQAVPPLRRSVHPGEPKKDTGQG